MRVALLASLTLGLLTPATAAALPGDPPVTLLAPANGADVPANPDGIGVRFTCPTYKQFDAGPFSTYGDYTDYSLMFATKPDLGTDGRLKDSNVIARDVLVLPSNVGPGQCTGVMRGGEVLEPGPQVTPGTYYWQADRICTGCPTGYEQSPVWNFTVRVELDLALSVQKKGYAGYPIVATLKARGVPSGAKVTVERRAGRSWKRATSARVFGERGYVVLALPRGRQRVRLKATVGTETVASPERVIRIVRPAHWTTSRRDDGSYRGQAESKPVALKVAAAGRQIRKFAAQVSTFCPGPTPDQNTFLIALAPIKRAKVAPDGRFYAIKRYRRQTVVELYGRVRRGRVKGTVRLTIGTCDGSASFSAKLKR